jgi:hypothetical protein
MRAGRLAAVALTIVIGACGDGGGSQATGTSTPPSPAGTTASVALEVRTYSTRAGGGFSFSSPASWRESTPATGQIEVVVGAPPEDADDGFVPNIDIVIEPLRVDLDTAAYFEASLQAVSASFDGFELRDQVAS